MTQTLPADDRPELGLRELKKQMTRTAIADSALRLAVEHGLDNVTIHRIAGLAFVSPRTFSNYFSCKEEAVVAAGTHELVAVVAAVADRPTAEGPWEALRAALSEFTGSRSAEQLHSMVQKLELEQQYPSLRPYESWFWSHLEDELRTVVAERTGSDADTQLYPWLVAASAVAGIRSAIRLWAASGDGAAGLAARVEDALDQLSSGLRAPTP
ncbi:TetR family transcriptional regulator [Georgenia yuyongxinii]|uniref:TetR family transcriptional regulator n=1 Tax=Georgenia yuyongxinii TaxID=2589797 RepID=A0A5B8C5M5_9MICO|nr:TetR/AcrR family transcriptional regulator [Georgenia yuyongxinii]QDC25764.1 TetR family transcriptional regulator [Georgenia yuyongxinii]